MNLKNIYPLIVPADYCANGTWILPHYKFANKSFILTWVIFSGEGAMLYLTQQKYLELNSIGQNWQAQAFENLRHSIGENENFFSSYKISSDGKRLIFIAFLNGDGIGSSRILLSDELTKAFPNGYYIALPDRSCGLIISKDIADREMREAKKLIKKMFKGATTPMSGMMHLPIEFVLPQDWLKSLDEEFSKTITNEIIKLYPK